MMPTSDPPPTEPAAPPGAADPAWDAPMTAEVRPEDALVIDIEGFEGPLDLLLALARTHKIDLARISILALVEQYLEFIAEAQKVNLEIAADYLVMAAWLAFLKSRLLLPKEKVAAGELSGEEMAARLAFRLQRLDAMRHAAAQLMTRKRFGIDVFGRGMPEGMRTIRQTQHTAQIYDLLKAYADQRVRTIKRVHVVRKRTVWSIKEARRRLERLVGASSGDWMQLDMFIEQYLPQQDGGGESAARCWRARSARRWRWRAKASSSCGRTLRIAPIYMRRKGAGEDWERVG